MNKKVLTILCFVLILLCISQVVMAKYIGTITDEEHFFDVAKPIINVDIKSFTDKVSPDDDIRIDFDVVNFDGTNINEVKLKYTISLISNDNLPLSFKLYDSNDNEIVLNNLTTTSSFYMPATNSTTHSYYIIASWNGNDSYVYQDLINDLDIKINVEQTAI